MVNENSLFGYINQESVSQVMEITGTFKCRAKTMVDVAIQFEANKRGEEQYARSRWGQF